jgi:hypothetical protein
MLENLRVLRLKPAQTGMNMVATQKLSGNSQRDAMDGKPPSVSFCTVMSAYLALRAPQHPFGGRCFVFFIFHAPKGHTLEVALRRGDTFFAKAKNIVRLYNRD